MSTITERWLAEFAEFAEFAGERARKCEHIQDSTSAVESQLSHCNESLEIMREEACVHKSTPAKYAKTANSDFGHVLDMESSSRGNCVFCHEPVFHHDGLRNWFGDLIHHRCAGKWKNQK